MSTRVISASTRYASEAARDAASGWDEGDVVYVTGIGYTVFDGSTWGALGGSGGGSVVGPYPIAFDTAGLATDGAYITTDVIPSGSLVTIHAVVTDAWDESTFLTIGPGVGTPGLDLVIAASEPTSTYRRPDLAPIGIGAPGWSEAPVTTIEGVLCPSLAVVTTEDARLAAFLLYDGSPSTTGAADIYAVVTEII